MYFATPCLSHTSVLQTSIAVGDDSQIIYWYSTCRINRALSSTGPTVQHRSTEYKYLVLIAGSDQRDLGRDPRHLTIGMLQIRIVISKGTAITLYRECEYEAAIRYY